MVSHDVRHGPDPVRLSPDTERIIRAFAGPCLANGAWTSAVQRTLWTYDLSADRALSSGCGSRDDGCACAPADQFFFMVPVVLVLRTAPAQGGEKTDSGSGSISSGIPRGGSGFGCGARFVHVERGQDGLDRDSPADEATTAAPFSPKPSSYAVQDPCSLPGHVHAHLAVRVGDELARHVDGHAVECAGEPER